MIRLITIDLLCQRTAEEIERFAIHSYGMHPSTGELFYQPEIVTKIQLSAHVWYFEIDDGVDRDDIYCVSYFTDQQMQLMGGTPATLLNGFKQALEHQFGFQLFYVEVLNDEVIVSTYKPVVREGAQVEAMTPEAFQQHLCPKAVDLSNFFASL